MWISLVLFFIAVFIIESTNSVILDSSPIAFMLSVATEPPKSSKISSIEDINETYGSITKPLLSINIFTASKFLLFVTSEKHTFILPFSNPNGTTWYLLAISIDI